MSFFDPYQAYVEGSVIGGNPLSTVIALYEGTIDSVRLARHYLETGDIMARGRAINKAVTLITELLATLDHEKGGEISANLGRLYAYMHRRLLDAHARKSAEALVEVEKLLDTMLEGWREAADKLDAESRGVGYAAASESELSGNGGFDYGFFQETPVLAGVISATF